MDAVLMVDDDIELCALVAEYLRGHGYDVSSVHDGASGLRAALEGRHQLVVLDVMLPVLDGFEVLRHLRHRSNVPVIMLTARADEADRVHGFNQGADDYLVKPFAAAELLGRVRAVLRRTSGSAALPNRVTQSGSVTLDAQSREAFRGGAALGLTPTEFAILDVLVRASGRVVSRDELAAILHQREATPYERSLDVHVSHLRRKIDGARGNDLGETAAAPVIRTVRGIGYSYAGDD
jgi:DNA-binding response OmpR family regulator